MCLTLLLHLYRGEDAYDDVSRVESPSARVKEGVVRDHHREDRHLKRGLQGFFLVFSLLRTPEASAALKAPFLNGNMSRFPSSWNLKGGGE